MRRMSGRHRLRTAFARFRRDVRGMTLLEILVVMVILGLLATLGSVQLMSYLGRAKADTAKLQIQELMTAVDLYRMDVGRPPTATEGLVALVEQPATASTWRGPYLRNRTILKDPWGQPYRYQPSVPDGDYELISFGADGQPGGERENGDVSSRSLR